MPVAATKGLENDQAGIDAGKLDAGIHHKERDSVCGYDKNV